MSISHRLAFVLIVTSALLIGGSALWDLQALRQRSNLHLETTGASVATRLASTASKAVYQLDEAVMADAIAAEFADPLVAGVIVRDGNDPAAKVFSGRVRGADGQLTAATDLVAGNALTRTDRSVTHDGKSIGLVQVQLDRGPAQAELRTATITLLGRALAMNILLVVVVLVILRRTVVAPICEARDRLREVAEGDGDLTRRLPVQGNDEIAAMSASFNLFVGNIQALVQRLTATAGELSASAADLDRTAAALRAGVEETSQRSRNAEATGKSIESDLQGITLSVQGMSSASQEIAQRTMEAAGLSETASNQGTVAAQAMAKLNTSTQQIADVLTTITAIASQVRMLSLNATIEAARAGEAGKGFAVVANEVKELANSTSKATGTIGARIEGILADSVAVTTAISQITVSVQQVSHSTSAIAAATEEQSATATEMGGTIRRVNDDSQTMSSTLGAVGQVATSSASAAGQVTATAAELAARANVLRELVGRFKA